MSPPIVHHRDYDAALPVDHRFPMGKFRRLAEILREDGLAPNGFHAPEPASADTLCLAHDADYVSLVLSGRAPPQLQRKIGLPLSMGVVRRARAATGGTLLTARLALAHGIACNTAGGSHHADREGGAGFCVFNDVAVAALRLLQDGAIGRALIVDLDVHQGDGTARLFASDDRVFTFSMHCEINFPARKARSDLDVALPAGTGDGDYLAALDLALPRAFAASRPDLVFFNAGVDPHQDDILGKLALTDEGLEARERMVLSQARGRGVPVAAVIGGGYGKDVDALARRHAIVHRVAGEFL